MKTESATFRRPRWFSSRAWRIFDRRVASLTFLAVLAGGLHSQEESTQEESADGKGSQGEVEDESFDEEFPEFDEFLDDDLDDLLDEGLDDLLEGGGDSQSEGFKSLLSLKGFVEFKPRIYFRDRGEEKNDEQLIFQTELEMNFRFSSNLTGYFRPRVFLDVRDGETRRFEPFEAYLTYEGEGWDLRGGQFVENWGIVDTFNPVDVVSRRDFATDFLDPERLGEFGVRLRRLFQGGETWGEPAVSLYVLPAWRETLFPGEDQRFSFDGEGLEFDEDEGLEPEGEERWFFASRYSGTLTTGPVNADLQAVVSRGPDRTPFITLAEPGLLVPVYFGSLTVGGGFRAVPNEDVAGSLLASLTLKAEVVYKDPYRLDRSLVPDLDDYVSYVLGIDREFYDVFRDQDSLSVTVEYAGEEGANDPTSLFRPFRNDLILRAFWEANDFSRTSIELRGIYDFDSGERIAEGILERQLRGIHEDLKLLVQLQWFDSPDSGESLFDFFPDNSSLAIGLRWDF